MWTDWDPRLAYYAVPLLAIWTIYIGLRKLSESRNVARYNEAREAGLSEPVSLHPAIDPALCFGCGACARVCPEGEVLGLISGKAVLVEPTSCIGHGACKAACPNHAISLVFGTETRGVDLPMVDPDFQTNVEGLYIAGELGGMGLIRNAIEQGRQAVEGIAASGRASHPELYDLVIVGGGPAGFAASLAALEKGLRFATLEQEAFGGTVAHFPRGKLVMTQPAVLPIVGPMPFREIDKERLLAFWTDAAQRTGLKIIHSARVDTIQRNSSGFQVVSTRGVYNARTVLLAIGRRGTPRRLDVPGEELSKVVYRLVDAAQYRNQNVLVVGGGDSALEAAASVAEEPNTRVTLSYRGEAFGRARPKNRKRIEMLAAQKRIKVFLGSNITAIEPEVVWIGTQGHNLKIKNDTVIVCAGGVLPTQFLRAIGVDIETKYGTA